jgi:hypothetical protein
MQRSIIRPSFLGRTASRGENRTQCFQISSILPSTDLQRFDGLLAIFFLWAQVHLPGQIPTANAYCYNLAGQQSLRREDGFIASNNWKAAIRFARFLALGPSQGWRGRVAATGGEVAGGLCREVAIPSASGHPGLTLQITTGDQVFR